MTRAEFNAMFIKTDGTWDTAAYVKYQEEKEAARIERVNKELDAIKMAYRVKDTDDNTFAYAGLENGFPVYRGTGGSKHIFDMNGLTVIQQYAE